MRQSKMRAMEHSGLPRVGTHAEFVGALEGMIAAPGPGDESAQTGRELRSYMLESHGGFPDRFEASGLRCLLRDTDLDYVKILNVQMSGGQCEFFLDKRDPRFLVLHTNERSGYASGIVKKLVQDTHHAFDHAWLHSDMLRNITEMPGNGFVGFGEPCSDRYLGSEEPCASTENPGTGGSAAPEAKTILENPRIGGAREHYTVRVVRGTASSMRGHVQDEVDSAGCFALKRGKSAAGHLDLVETCRKKYAETVERIESLRIGTRLEDGESVFGGSPFHFKFGKNVEDPDAFISELFNSAMPFRLWGIKSAISEGYFKVMGIDLHTSSTVDFEIAGDMMRAYLRKGGCGNTILRLLTNLQIHHDAGDTCAQVARLGRKQACGA